MTGACARASIAGTRSCRRSSSASTPTPPPARSGSAWPSSTRSSRAWPIWRCRYPTATRSIRCAAMSRCCATSCATRRASSRTRAPRRNSAPTAPLLGCRQRTRRPAAAHVDRRGSMIEIGVFDHLDRGAVPLGEHYESRLTLAEAYDRLGIRTYHVAEHHATPLGMAPSPSVFLAAVAQRTRRMRFGPLVYTLSLYHPLRLVEEICMLDQMSRGRFELGIGRGISPYEVGYYGVDPAKAQAIYIEALGVILAGLKSKTLDHTGEFFRFNDVPVVLEPVQRPHPPLWYGLARPEGLPWVVANRVNIVCNGPPALVRQVTDGYRRDWAAARHAADTLPLMGMTRTIVVADSDADALAIARRAHKRWH